MLRFDPKLQTIKFSDELLLSIPSYLGIAFPIYETKKQIKCQYSETVEEPEAIYEGKAGEYIAIKEIEKDKYIVAIYKELSKEDGFVISTTRNSGI